MSESNPVSDDVRTLHRLGYAQELSRVLGGFSNFAISLSIICILAGGLTSFSVAYCATGGAGVALGWPLMCLLSLAVAATMGQVASAFPTAGGLYHWASILGGRGWGWATAWFNLAGLVTVLAAINAGTGLFVISLLGVSTAEYPIWLLLGVAGITFSQAWLNHLGIGVVRILTDFSGWWILGVSAMLTGCLLAFAPNLDLDRLTTFTNFSGDRGGGVWPEASSMIWLFALGLLLPAYTITGFDASAHASEETVRAAINVPRGIVRSVWVSGLFGWVMVCAIVLAMPDPDAAAALGSGAFVDTLFRVVPAPLSAILGGSIVIAQYLCGLATVTSASRMTFAFARDGGLPFSRAIRWVSPRYRTPPVAIWVVALGAVGFTLYARVYETIAAVCVILLYISYVLPTAIGFVAHRRWWTEFGPWQLGRWYKPLAMLSVFACCGLIVIGMQPPNQIAVSVVGGMIVVLGVIWIAYARRHFPGPPHGVLSLKRQSEIQAAEDAVHETSGPAEVTNPSATHE